MCNAFLPKHTVLQVICSVIFGGVQNIIFITMKHLVLI